MARNAEETIGASVASVACQTYHNIEHIIIDGASTDRTVDRAREGSSRIARIVSEKDHGIYDAMNKGINMATGDIVGLVNADDLLENSKVLNQIVETLEKNPRAAGCYSDLVYVGRNTPGKIKRFWKSSPFRPGLFARGWVPPHPTVYLRRSVYEQIGGFDTRYRLAADYEFLLRLFEVNRLPMIYSPHIWIRMRLGGATNMNRANIVAGNREIAAALRAHHQGWPPLVLTLKLLRRVPQFLRKGSASR